MVSDDVFLHFLHLLDLLELMEALQVAEIGLLSLVRPLEVLLGVQGVLVGHWILLQRAEVCWLWSLGLACHSVNCELLTLLRRALVRSLPFPQLVPLALAELVIVIVLVL